MRIKFIVLSVMVLMFFLTSCTNNTHVSYVKNQKRILSNYRDTLFQSLESILDVNSDSVFNVSLREDSLLKFPEEILKCRNLKFLDLSMNLFDTIPSNINQLSSLEVLIIAYSKLKAWPHSICELKSLKEISFVYNNLVDIPECIVKLEQLETLNLNGSLINKIPRNLHLLRQLKKLYLTNDKEKTLLSKEDEKYLIDSFKNVDCVVSFGSIYNPINLLPSEKE